ncbi:hypothetical protein GQ42DRAFT_153363 [Ramicandelaber brevisporus]|nr:hypothetical protein GQ42DRAFT_153363 [Ramicandelaber brevisporus]
MTFTPVEEARAVCAKFVAASAPDEQAVELDRVHCWLTEAVPPRFLELSQHEQRNLALSPAISKLIDRVAALAQVDGLAAALMAVLCSKISNVVARAAELAAILATSFKFMQSPSRNVSLLPQSMLADAHLVRALIDLLESTESGDILKLVCIALTGIISHAPAGYDTVLARGIVRIGVTRIRQLSSSSPHLSTLLATVVFMSKHQPSAPKTTYSALGPSSRSNDGPYVRTDSEVEWRNYNFNDGPVSFASAIPLIASHIGDIEQHFKDCLLSVDDHQASALVAAGLTGVAGLIGSGIPVSVFSDTAVVSRIAYHLSRGVPEAVRLVEVVNKHGSVAAKNTIKAALPDFQVVVGDVVRVLSSLSVGTNDTVVLINQLDMIARLYSFDTGLRTSILDSMLIELLLRLLRDGEAEPVLILAAIRTLASVAQSTLSPPSAYEAGIALEALYAVCNDLTLVDRHRIVALCRKLFQGSGHIAVLRPAGIVLDAVVRTLAADDAERTVIFSDIATALDPSASRSLTRRAVAILNHETGMPPKNPMSRPMNEVPSGFATSDILRALHALIVASRVNPVGEFDDMLLRDVIRVVMWYRQTSLLSVFSLHHSLQLDDAVVDIILDEACSVEVRFCALRFIIKLVNSQLRGNRDRRLKQPVLERLLLQLVGQLDSLHPHLTHLAFRLAKCAINENISEETKQSLSATCLQHCGRLRYCGAPSVPALLCAAVIVVICSPYSVDGIPVALSEVANIVCDASRSIDSHPYRAHLPNCLEHLSIILRCQKLNVELPDHGKMIDAVLSIVCHDNLPEAVLKPTVLNLQKLTCDVPLANVTHYAARIQSELDLKLANSNPDAYTHTLLSLLFHSHGRPTRFRSLFKSNVLYERVVKQLDCSIDNETFPAIAELYRETIRDHSARLSDHGIRQWRSDAPTGFGHSRYDSQHSG